jgi:hypothetical protein
LVELRNIIALGGRLRLRHVSGDLLRLLDCRSGLGGASLGCAERKPSRQARIAGDRRDARQSGNLIGRLARLGERHPLLDPAIDELG